MILQSAILGCSRSLFKGFPQPADDVHKPNHVVVSTGSGTGLAQNVWKDLVKPTLDALSISEYQFHLTQSDSSVAELAQDVLLPRANEGKSQTVMLLSGDGGILDVVNSLLSGERSEGYRKPSIAVLPLGTGNALANSSGIAADNTYGLRSWLQGSLKELPLFAATFSDGARFLVDEARQERPLHLENGVPIAHGAVVCSWGLHAALVADSDTQEYRKFGAERFKMAAKEALFPSDGSPPHAYKGEVSILRTGQKEWEVVRKGEHGYILATPVSQLEKGFTISPSSKPLNEKLRLVHFGPVSGEAAMEIMTKAYHGGQHVQDERVGYDEIDAMRIEFHEEDGRWRRICIDGKIVRVERGGWVEVRAGQKGVLDLIVP